MQAEDNDSSRGCGNRNVSIIIRSIGRSRSIVVGVLVGILALLV